MKQNMCEICNRSEVKRIEVLTKTRIPHKAVREVIFCTYLLSFKQKWVTFGECSYYRPKVGKFEIQNGKTLEQTTIFNYNDYRPKQGAIKIVKCKRVKQAKF